MVIVKLQDRRGGTEPWTVLRFDTKIKLHLKQHGAQTPAQIATALGKLENEVLEVLKERSKGDRVLFVENDGKYAAKS